MRRLQANFQLRLDLAFSVEQVLSASFYHSLFFFVFFCFFLWLTLLMAKGFFSVFLNKRPCFVCCPSFSYGISFLYLFFFLILLLLLPPPPLLLLLLLLFLEREALKASHLTKTKKRSLHLLIFQMKAPRLAQLLSNPLTTWPKKIETAARSAVQVHPRSSMHAL